MGWCMGPARTGLCDTLDSCIAGLGYWGNMEISVCSYARMYCRIFIARYDVRQAFVSKNVLKNFETEKNPYSDVPDRVTAAAAAAAARGGRRGEAGGPRRARTKKNTIFFRAERNV